MKLLKYLEKSGLDPETNKFRMLKLKLVDQETEHEKIVEEVGKKYDLETDTILELRQLLNKDLKAKGYKGPKIFDFVLDEGENVDTLKIDRRRKGALKRKHLELQESLDAIKSKFERELKESR
jgi:hypothetical protein